MLTHSNADILIAVMCQADTSLGNSRRSNVAGARQALTAFDGRFRITSTTYHIYPRVSETSKPLIKRCFCLTSVCLTSDVCLSRTSGLTRERRGLGRLKSAQR